MPALVELTIITFVIVFCFMYLALTRRDRSKRNARLTAALAVPKPDPHEELMLKYYSPMSEEEAQQLQQETWR